MTLDLATIHDSRIAPGTKGVPTSAYGLRVGDVGTQGWNLLANDLPLPVAVLKASALANNIAEMQAYLDRSGLHIAPHGKTTMCPDLFDRQLGAGAWGMTVATFAQAQLAHSVGVRRILIANEVTGACEIDGLADLLARDPSLELYLLVDSIAGADLLQKGFAGAARPARVLVELGVAGGRCGCRTQVEALALARHIADLPSLVLTGLEAYEGLIGSGDAARDATEVTAFLDRVANIFAAMLDEGLFPVGTVLLTAGGSAYFDLVARSFATQASARIVPVLRSGCYLTHDDGLYQRLLRSLGKRDAEAPRLRPALEIWAGVLSRPEPDHAILSAGKRDLSFDIDLPIPLACFRHGEMNVPTAVSGWSVFQLSDQHAFLRIAADDDLAVGDMVCLGISHPCTTFDKWPLLLEVDDDYRVIAGLKTCF